MQVDSYDHLSEDPDPVLDYALDHGFANLHERVGDGDALREYAHKLLMALLVGLTAGFSTCMALIGGLVLSVASKYAENHPAETPLQKFRPHLIFNLGRIVSFVVLGAVIGAIGSAFSLKGSMLGFLTIIVGVVMLVLGLQLTEAFPRITKGLTLPSGLAKKLGIKQRGER